MNFNGTPKDWIELFKKNAIAEQGVVMIIFGNEQPLETFVAGWHNVLATATNIKGERAFSSVEHIGPANIGARNVVNELKAAVENQLVAKGVPKDRSNQIADGIKYHALSAYDATEVIKTIDHIKEGAAVAISCAQLYRYNEIISGVNDVTYKTWFGAEYRANIKEDIYFDHLMRLIAELLKKAREKKIFISIFCEELGLVNQLPAHLENHPDLVVIAMGSDNIRKKYRMIREWVGRLRKEGIEKILTEVNASILDAHNRARITALLYSTNQQFHKAWETIAPYFDEIMNSDKTSVLSASSTALAAGKTKESESLLRSALKQGLDSFEELNSAYQIAKGLNLRDFREMLINRMILVYPNHPTSLWFRFDQYINVRDYASALEIAKKLEDDFFIQVCETFNKSPLALDDFLINAEKMGKLENAYILAAQEAEYRSEIALAKELSVKVKVDVNFLSTAMQVRARVLGKLIRTQHKINESDIAELKEILHFAASHPVDFDIRFEVEELLEAGVEEPAALLMLNSILLKEIEESFVNVVTHNFKFKTADGLIMDPTYIENSEEAYLRFWEELLSELPTTIAFFGMGKISGALKNQINPKLIGALSQALLYGIHHIENSNFSFIELLLHIIALLSKEVENPNSDFIAMRSAIGHLINEGYIQKARDLSETAIQYMTELHIEHRDWRMGQAWACYADAFHRSGNYLAALRCLCYCFISCGSFDINRNLLNSNYRLACRIFRDLGLTEFALKTLEIEQQVIEKTDSDKYYLHQIEEVKFIILSSKIDKSTKPEEILEYIEKADQFLTDEYNREVQPLLIAQAYLLKRLKEAGGEPQHHIIDTFKARCDNLSKLPQEVLNSVLIESPTRTDLEQAFNRVSYARSLQDLAFQITPCRGLAINAISSSCDKNDIDLFLLASTVLSQPILSLRAYSSSENSLLNRSHLKMQKWVLQMAFVHDQKAERLADAITVFQDIESRIKRTVSEINNVSLAKLQSIIEPNETIIVITHDSNKNICHAEINKNSLVGPKKIGQQIWSPIKYKEWRKFYPRSYGEWIPAVGPFDKELPTVQMIRGSVENLSIGQFKQKKLLIIPDAEMFGFPFALSPNGNRFLCEDISIGIAPSVSWLISTRSKSFVPNLTKRAWLGSPKSQDWTLLYLKDKLTPALDKFHYAIVDSESPSHLEGSDVVLAISHGGVGIADHFRTITDKVRNYAVEEFANKFKNCGCVVLFICSSGRSDNKIGTMETVGLVSALLQVGVRAVVAPPWPLHAYVAETWLPPFLESLHAGNSVGLSSNIASKEIRKRFDNPCAWAAFHVYGDQELSVMMIAESS
jgi:hypothetical protein